MTPRSPGRGQSSATQQRLPGESMVQPLMTDELPFVLINMAMTLDGKIATANRKVSSFSSGRDHEHLLELRATTDAVMAGSRTVNLSPINLGPGPARFRRRRIQRGLSEYNLRVVVSGSGTIRNDAEVFKHRFSPILILTTARASRERLRRLGSLADDVKVCGRHEVDFRVALRWLRREYGVRRLLCEGGGELNDALFRAGLVNELHLTVCPKIFGGRSAPTIADGLGFKELKQASQFRLKSMRRVRDEIFLVFEHKIEDR